LKFESFAQKTWFIKVLILRPKMLYNSSTSTFNFKKIPGLYSRAPVKKERGERGRGGEGGAREESPPIHIPGYATVSVDAR